MAYMRRSFLLLTATLALLACGPLGAYGTPLGAYETPPTPENIVGAMSAKLLRGLVNVVTCPVELPRQIDRQIRERGVWEGSCVGLVAGIGMTVVRGVVGGIEAAMFLVPAPGYYDPLNTPAFAWEDWGAPSEL